MQSHTTMAIQVLFSNILHLISSQILFLGEIISLLREGASANHVRLIDDESFGLAFSSLRTRKLAFRVSRVLFEDSIERGNEIARARKKRILSVG